MQVGYISEFIFVTKNPKKMFGWMGGGGGLVGVFGAGVSEFSLIFFFFFFLGGGGAGGDGARANELKKNPN